jgi:isohexenylglutaconyl-CoA hydratase
MAVTYPDYETLLVERDGARLHVTLNRPEAKNAINPTMQQELADAFGKMRGDSDAKVIVLRGAGGVFCAGGDLKAMREMPDPPQAGETDEIAVNNRKYGTFLEAANTMPQVVVAALEGPVLAGGFGLASISDITIGTADTFYAMTEVRLGLVPAQIAPFVARRIGIPMTRRLTLSGARFGAGKALEIGYLHEVVEDAAALDKRLEEVLGEIDLCGREALARTKAVINALNEMPLSDVLDMAADHFAGAIRGAEAAEGLKAFVEKRKPDWAGRN